MRGAGQSPIYHLSYVFIHVNEYFLNCHSSRTEVRLKMGSRGVSLAG